MSDPARASRTDSERRATAQRAAEATRRACIETAIRAYQDASISGLCGEGALEAAVSAMRVLDLERIVEAQATDRDPP